MEWSWKDYEQPLPQAGFDGICGREDWKAALTGWTVGWELAGELKTPCGLRLLISGEEGAGKTALARAFAGELGFRFFSLRMRELSAAGAYGGTSGAEGFYQGLPDGEPFLVLLEETDEAAPDETVLLLERLWEHLRDRALPYVWIMTARQEERTPAALRRDALLCRLGRPDTGERAAYLEGTLGRRAMCRGGYGWAQMAQETEGFSFSQLQTASQLAMALLIERGMRTYGGPDALSEALSSGALRLTPEVFGRAAAMAGPAEGEDRPAGQTAHDMRTSEICERETAVQTDGAVLLAGTVSSVGTVSPAGGDVAYNILLDDIFGADSAMNPENL